MPRCTQVLSILEQVQRDMEGVPMDHLLLAGGEVAEDANAMETPFSALPFDLDAL